jgi:PadR family transcriptional regulator, regulatory protein PadR
MTGRKPVPKKPSDLLQGTADVLILRTLAWEPMHGYAVSRFIGERTGGVLAVDGAALYQALHRLERRKLISASWGLSENNRKAKYYRLTARGRATLRDESAVWQSYAAAVGKLLNQE